MIKQDAAKYTDFCHHIEGYGGFSPWLDEYDPLTETGFAFVHGGSEDNGQFGLGDIDLNFGTTEFSYKDILEKVKKYRDECKGQMDPDFPEECEYVEELDELVRAITDWCSENESKKSEALTKDTVVVGTLDNSNKKWIERTLQQIKKKFPNVESDAFGCTITVRGKLADVAKVLNAYPKGIPSWCSDKGGDFLPNAAGDNLDDNEVSKVLSESKKNEGVGGKIKMGIDYNMFMRMCASAAYLDDNEDYWDALWEYYSEMGEIEDACEFFDNLFQYTSWCDEDEVYDEYLDDSYKDGTKSKAECIDAAVDAGDLDVFKTDKGYLVIQ